MIVKIEKMLDGSIVLIVTTRKGGVGKTTTVLSFSSFLTLMGFKVLVIDTDMQASCSKSLGITNPEKTLYHVLHYDVDPKECIYRSSYGMDVLPAEEALKTTIPYDVSDTKIFEEKLGLLKDEYDFILIDTPSTENEIITNACAFADHVISPIFPTHDAFEGYKLLTKSLAEMTNKGIEINNLGILVTKFAKKALRADYLEALRESYPELVFDTTISDSSIFEWAEGNMPLFYLEKSHKVTKMYFQATLELLSRLGFDETSVLECTRRGYKAINTRGGIDFE